VFAQKNLFFTKKIIVFLIEMQNDVTLAYHVVFTAMDMNRSITVTPFFHLSALDWRQMHCVTSFTYALLQTCNGMNGRAKHYRFSGAMDGVDIFSLWTCPSNL
jgi:hypothetical protein